MGGDSPHSIYVGREAEVSRVPAGGEEAGERPPFRRPPCQHHQGEGEGKKKTKKPPRLSCPDPIGPLGLSHR